VVRTPVNARVGELSRGGNVQPVNFSGPGMANYRRPLMLGSAQATYFEDNEVYIAPFAGTAGKRTGNNPWIAPNNAARIVIRHNKLVNSQLEIYGHNRNQQPGCQSAEIYDNQFSTTEEGRPQGFIFIGAGMAIAFNNTVTGTGYNNRTIVLGNTKVGSRKAPIDGKPEGKPPSQSNQVPADPAEEDRPWPGLVGHATDADGDGVFEPTPCYAWNNTINGQKLLMAVGKKNPKDLEQIKEGREFYNEKPPEGYYKPYVYPHPLQRGP
jgi:hypothetical protein